MSVLIFLFSGLANHSTQTLSTILVAYLVIVSATNNIECLSILSPILSASNCLEVLLLSYDHILW